MNIIASIAVTLVLFGSTQPSFAASKYDYAVPAIREAARNGRVGYWSVGEPKYQSEVINNVKYVVADISQISSHNEMVLSVEDPQGHYEPIARVELGDAPYPIIGIHDGAVNIRTGYGHHGTYSTEYAFKLHGGKFRLANVRAFADYNNYYDAPSVQTVSLLLLNFEELQAQIWIRRFEFNTTSAPGNPSFESWSHALSSYRKTSTLPFPSCVTMKVEENDFVLDGFDIGEFEQWMRTHIWSKASCPSTKFTSN